MRYKKFKNLLSLFYIFYLHTFVISLFAQEEIKEIIETVKEQLDLSEKEKKAEAGEEGIIKPQQVEGVPYGTPKLPSPIEQMFREKFPIGVSKNIFQFGYRIFGKPSTTFAPLETYPVPPDYVLGPGDELILNIWGKVQETIKVTIDREGKIILPKAGAVYVWGLKFEDAKSLITNQLNMHYTHIHLNITMGRLRSIKVFILGEVKQPGSYTLSSLSTLFHALHNAGGPTDLGSLRNIELINTGKKIIDLYDILLYGNKESDYTLNSGDIIYVPLIGKVVGIAGSVKRPAIYEVKPGETLKDIIEMAGGVTPIGYLKRIQIERIKEHKNKVVMDLEFTDIDDFNKKIGDFELEDGDLILISPILPEKHNYVSIFGNVRRPGEYELKEPLTIKSLIEKAEGLLPGTYFERAEISRFRANKTREIIPINLELALAGDTIHNIQLKEWDELTIYAETDVVPEQYVKITGPVRRPGEYKLTPNMTINDLIFRAGGCLTTADLQHSELSRMLSKSSPTVISLNLEDSTTRTIKLMPQDWVFVRQKRDWAYLPKITITGEVMYPGTYVVNENESIGSLIKRAGGFTKEAFLKGAVFTRKLAKQSQQSAINEFVSSAQKRLLEELAKAKSPEIISVLEQRKKLIDIISEVEVPGRVIIDLYTPNSNDYNIPVEDGDSLHIPSIPNTVQVLGCVYNPSGVMYREGESVSWYLAQVGGITKEGDRGEIYILKASGEVTRGSKVERGDAIIVPEKFEIRKPMGDVVKDATQILYQLGFSALAISALIAR